MSSMDDARIMAIGAPNQNLVAVPGDVAIVDVDGGAGTAAEDEEIMTAWLDSTDPEIVSHIELVEGRILSRIVASSISMMALHLFVAFLAAWLVTTAVGNVFPLLCSSQEHNNSELLRSLD